MIFTLVTFFHSQDGVYTGVEIEPCFPAVKNEICNMTCRVPDFTCTIFGCSPNMIKEVGDTVILQILSLSYTNDACELTCTYGATSSLDITLTIYSKYVVYIIRICGIKKIILEYGFCHMSLSISSTKRPPTFRLSHVFLSQCC